MPGVVADVELRYSRIYRIVIYIYNHRYRHHHDLVKVKSRMCILR